jgi:FMN-dependent oxidoreductase (nitrilotriacetate monooxygenase family)
MAPKPFHLAWFTQYSPPVWNGPWSGDAATSWADGSFFVEMAQALERGCFDYIMLEDSLLVPDVYGDSMDLALKHAYQAPKLDPVLLLARMGAATKHLGMVATMSTSFWPPFLLARQMATIDHMTHGRAGWNIVTSSEDRAAQNFGLERLFEHDQRYEMATEYTQLVQELWASWDADSVVLDREAGVYAIGEKVRPVHFTGKWFSSRGPLNTPPMPQGRPVICQAGSSVAGRDFAAKYAETILAVPTGIERMREFREDIHRRMKECGRDPAEVKILFLAELVIAETEAAARAKMKQLFEPTDENVQLGLMSMSTVTDIDFSTFDVDKPLPADLTTNGHQSSLKNFYSYGETLREIAVTWLRHYTDPTLVGTPEQLAIRMGEIMEAVGGDGFLITGPLTREYIVQVVDGLVPQLQRMGLTRREYMHRTLREHLQEF